VRDVQVEQSFVQAVALADGEEVEVVVVVRHDQDARVSPLPVDGHAQPARVACEQSERFQHGGRPSSFPPVDEARVQPERDVVQEQAAVHARDVDPLLAARKGPERSGGVATIDAQVAGEVVEGAERNGDERKRPLDRDLRD
jgi:hypothetical protein